MPLLSIYLVQDCCHIETMEQIQQFSIEGTNTLYASLRRNVALLANPHTDALSWQNWGKGLAPVSGKTKGLHAMGTVL